MDIEETKSHQPLSSLDKINIAENLKEEGNTLFSQGDYTQAIKKYVKVFLYIEGLITQNHELAMYSQDTISDSLHCRVQDIKEKVNLNMAACFIKLNNFQKALDRANKAFAINQSAKAYFRRGVAQTGLGNLDEAEVELKKALDLEPDSVPIKNELKKLSALQKKQFQSQKQKFKGFFDKYSSES